MIKCTRKSIVAFLNMPRFLPALASYLPIHIFLKDCSTCLARRRNKRVQGKSAPTKEKNQANTCRRLTPIMY